MNKRGRAGVLIVFLLIFLAAVLVLGHLGGKEAQKENNECTFGVGDKWCWIWATNVYEESSEEACLDPEGNMIC